MRHLKLGIPMEAETYNYTYTYCFNVHSTPFPPVCASLNPSPLSPAGSARIVLHD